MENAIEKALPLSPYKETSHPDNLHLWWGRTPIDLAYRVLSASVQDVSEKPTVFDPFCGSGMIPLAAQKLGMNVVAGDLNPVAAMITMALTELPARFKDCNLAKDIRAYGEWIEKKARERLSTIYPDQNGTAPSAWLWIRTVKCPNPACGCEMPLATSFILSGRKDHEAWAEPIVEDGKIHFAVHKGICPPEKVTNKYGTYGAKFVCPACGEITADGYVKRMGLECKLSAQMMAVLVNKEFISPDDAQIVAADVPRPDNAPHGSIPDNAHWFSPPGFGFTEYADLFSNRQLTMLTTFCELLTEVQNKAASDAFAAGMNPEGGSLSTGGAGALAYGQAISVYLAFAIDKMADRNSMFGSWHSSGGNPRATFGRQAIPMVWNWGEINPFTSITGNFAAAVKQVADAIDLLPTRGEAKVTQMDARTADYPKNVMVCTELPYYKNIGYAHLSDYFYIWMRQSLKPVFPDLFGQMVTSKEELSTVSQYYGVQQSEAENSYRDDLERVLLKLYDCQDPDWPALIFYEFHKADEECIRNESKVVTNWEHLLQTMTDDGFTISATWPLEEDRILIVAFANEKTEQTTRRGFINTLKHELPELMQEVSEKNLMVGMGRGLHIFTRYRKVINADGSTMSVHDALPIIWQEAEETIAIDADTEEEKNDAGKL